MKYEVAGDPVSGLRWTRKTTKKIAAELSALGIRVSRKTVAKLLKQMNFSLRTNKKKISNGSPPTRDAQFANITQLRERFSRRGNPILSVDTKKKELVGRFKNPGRVWAQKSDAVNDHDFRSMATAAFTCGRTRTFSTLAMSPQLGLQSPAASAHDEPTRCPFHKLDRSDLRTVRDRGIRRGVTTASVIVAVRVL